MLYYIYDAGIETCMGKVDRGLAVTVVVGLAVLCGVVLVAFALAPDTVAPVDVLRVIQSSVTILAIVAGGLFAAYKWQVFRESEPHLTITHEVSYRRVGESYVHIAVTATLENNAKVQTELHDGNFLIQQIAPALDEDVEAMYAQVFVEEEFVDIPWPILVDVQREWEEGELIIEPGELHPETFELLVSEEVKSVMIYTYFFNSSYSQGTRSAEGWGATTVLDIIDL